MNEEILEKPANLPDLESVEEVRKAVIASEILNRKW